MKRIVFLVALALASPLAARDVAGELESAERFGRQAASLVRGLELRLFWSEAKLVWREETGTGHRFRAAELDSGLIADAFDHGALARALAEATGEELDPTRLPIDRIEPAPEGMRLRALGKGWLFSGGTLAEDDVPPQETALIAPEDAPRRSRGTGAPTSITIANATNKEIELFWLETGGERRSYGRVAPGESWTQNTYAGHVWLAADADGEGLAALVATEEPAFARVTGRIAPSPRRERRQPRDRSPDGKWSAFIRDHDVFVRATDGGETLRLSEDGSAEDPYRPPFYWSPDSRKLVAMRAPRVEERKIHIVESSPRDQLQPKLRTLNYNKPGDPIEQPKPRLFHLDGPRQVPVDDALFENPWDVRDFGWAADSSEFSFVYNQRGHQVMRIVGVDAESGETRAIHEERSETFIDYSQKFFLRRLADGRILWASERSGWNHLYLVDPKTSSAQPVTRGSWNVRDVEEVDEENGTILFRWVGDERQDPYHHHFARVNLDGSGLTRLTESDGTHRLKFSPDGRHYVATWSRVDQPPVSELRRTADGSLVAEFHRADDAPLRESGWTRPERFVAKGRDGRTDIHGIIVKPRNFDPSRNYAVVEDIYAGPHDHFVPKSYSPWLGMNTMAELGFVVVKIDGMGTNWRSKAFHDVAWKNLSDSGFPDRIAWIKAAAADRPWMDLSRVGIFGGSAGGQSTLAGLLHHGDFYKVGVADCGCHDNRMDKIWWNEAWMGWPVDESYERNSNTVHASKLQGKLMLIVGELDSNVDPASTAQVVHALQQAGKEFDFVPIINAGHGAAETPYGKFRRAAFLTRHLGEPSEG